MKRRRWPWVSKLDWCKIVFLSHRLIEMEKVRRIPIVPGRPEDFGK